MSRKVIPTFPHLSSAQLVGQLLPRWADSWKLQSREGQRGSCHGTDKKREGEPQHLPHFMALALSRMFARHSRDTTAGCARAAAWVTAPESHSSSLTKICFWGSVQSLCSAPVTAGQAVCQRCFRLPQPCTLPTLWSSTFFQCSGPWCFREAFVHKDNKSCWYLPECWHHLYLLFWKGVRVNNSSGQTQCNCPWWFSLSSLIINASSPCQHF